MKEKIRWRISQNEKLKEQFASLEALRDEESYNHRMVTVLFNDTAQAIKNSTPFFDITTLGRFAEKFGYSIYNKGRELTVLQHYHCKHWDTFTEEDIALLLDTCVKVLYLTETGKEILVDAICTAVSKHKKEEVVVVPKKTFIERMKNLW